MGLRIYAIIPLSCLPDSVRVLFRGMPGVFKGRHHLLLCWLVLMQAVGSGPKTLAALSRSAPEHVREYRLRRLLKASYWSIHLLVDWLAAETIRVLPPPQDATLYLIGDGSHKEKRGKKNPLAQKGRTNQEQHWFFGIRFVVLLASWDIYRVPVGFRIILPKAHPDYRTENALFREMIEGFAPPGWARRMIVCGDAAYGSRENMALVRRLNTGERTWGFVFAISRTWKMENGKKIKDLVLHLPRRLYRKTWIPRLSDEKRRKTLWTYGKRTRLRHIGDVTVVLSKTGRNVGPKHTKILVTNLAELTPRQVVSVYQRRWQVEILFKELKSGLGLGEHQVTRTEERIEKSIGISLLSYLFLIHSGREHLRSGKPWSIFQLQNGLRLELTVNQVRHATELEVEKLRKAA